MTTASSCGVRVVLAVAFVATMARPASADWLFTPYLGMVLGGAANTVDVDTLDEAFEQRSIVGGSLTAMSNGVLGFEVDFGYAPNFFQLTEGGEDFEFFDVNSSITTLMGNVVFGVPIGGTSGSGVRPYLAGGVGLMRASIRFEDLFEDLSSNDFAVNVGGGVHVFFSDGLGLRGDVRYFRGIEIKSDEDLIADFSQFGLDDFHFWRATVGVTFRFGS